METIELSYEDYNFLLELQQELTTQDNDGNADPVYWGVMERKLEPVPDGCGDVYILMGDGVCMTLEDACQFVKENIDEYDDNLKILWEGTVKDVITDVFEFIHDDMGIKSAQIVNMEERSFLSQWTGAFITKRACRNYIRNFGYNHSKPHTYAMTAYRNFELQRLLNILRNGLNFVPARKSIWHKTTEDADPKRLVVLSDGVDHISERLRWPFAEFIRDSKKEGINFTKWAYLDEIMKLQQ